MKQPDWKVPCILAFSLLVLGTFAYWLQYSHKPKQNKADAQLKKPIALPNEDVQIVQFRIKSAGGIIEGKCDSLPLKTCKATTKGNWTLTSPSQLKGDSDNIKEVLTTATSMLAAETIDLTEETPEKRKTLLDEYGLSDDKRTKIGTEFLEVTLEDGKKLTAWFGEPYPMGDKVFVGSSVNGNLNDKTVFILANFYKGVFSKPLTYFRDKTVVDFNRSDITEIDAKTSKGKFEAHLDNGNWLINGQRGDSDRIGSLLSAFAMVRAKEFVSKDALKGAKSILRYDLKAKTTTYALELFEKTSKPIKIKGHEDVPGESHIYMQSSTLPEPVEVDQLIKTQTDKGLGELRYNIALSAAEKATFTEVKVEGKTAAMAFHFNGKAWVQKDSGTKVDPAHVGRLLDNLTVEHSMDIVSPAPPVGSVEVTLSTGDEKTAVKPHFIFYNVKDKTYAKDLSQNKNEAYVVDPAVRTEIPFDITSWNPPAAEPAQKAAK